MRAVIALLAAGRGRRMGGADKLLKRWRGAPLLTHVAKAARRGTGQDRLIVCLNPASFRPRAAALHGTGAQTIRIRDADQGMSASLRAAARFALRQKAQGLIVIPADLAGLTASDLAQIRRRFAAAPHQALRSWDGAGYGHPTALPRALLPKLLRLKGEAGARDLIKAPRRYRMASARQDFDRPEDFLD